MTKKQASLPQAPAPGGASMKAETGKSPHASEPDAALAVHRAAVLAGVIAPSGEPTERERVAAEQARDRLSAHAPLAIIIEDEEGVLTGPYDDGDANRARMLDAFGTNSIFFLARSVHHLRNMLTQPNEKSTADLPALNAGLAIVAAVAPADELEAALAVQMAGTHALGCEMMGRAMRNTDIDRMNTYVNAATKLQRTFTAQLEALARMRGKGQQTVRVEHVTVEPGAQAIVGDVHHHHPQEKNHAAAARVGARPPLPSPDPLRNGVPIGGDGERSVPHARRREHRRAAGKSERPQTRVLHPERDP